MLNYTPKTVTLSDSFDGRGNDRSSLNQTPSKRSKYDSFTPRKRYIKQQEEFDSYRNMQFQLNNDIPYHFSMQKETPDVYSSHNRNNAIRKKQHLEPQQAKKYHINDLYADNFVKLYPTEAKIPLKEYNVNPNCPTSARQAKFRNYFQNKEVCKKIYFQDDQNRNRMNIGASRHKGERIERNKKRYLDIQAEVCLTPRRSNKKKQDIFGEMNEKISIVQAKIAKLERMTPKRNSKTKISQIIQTPLVEFSNYQPQKQETKLQSSVCSRVSISSQRQNEIMSRVSLDRLVEEQQCESEIEVIQDLSHKISSKLRSIIRNFG